VRASFAGFEIHALWIAKPENIRYLSGFTAPKDAKLLVTATDAVLYTDARYLVQANEESRVPVHIARFDEVYAHAKPLTQGMNVGFEADAVLYSQFSELLNGLETTLRPVTGIVEPLRAVKNADEVQHIRHAAQIADVALEHVQARIRPGVTEREIALELEFEMRRAGADGPAFEIIVASGERGAMPHGTASDKVIADGELVTVDWGALVHGYHSDCTRTFAVGKVNDELRKIYNVVLEAQRLGVAAVKPGGSCFEADKVARNCITAAGYGEYFGHSLGHGVGLQVHEGPNLSFRSPPEQRLEPGNVVTVEPGIYVPGVGGVRIEDLVLVTEDGAEVLTRLPKARV
jgi:Xaa-Pro aminopeptidase/Xaa-Pro dipeptidase